MRRRRRWCRWIENNPSVLWKAQWRDAEGESGEIHRKATTIEFVRRRKSIWLAKSWAVPAKCDQNPISALKSKILNGTIFKFRSAFFGFAVSHLQISASNSIAGELEKSSEAAGPTWLSASAQHFRSSSRMAAHLRVADVSSAILHSDLPRVFLMWKYLNKRDYDFHLFTVCVCVCGLLTGIVADN